MAQGINKHTLVGRVGKDPEITSYGEGKEIVKFSVAVNKKRKGVNHTSWFNVTCFGFNADIAKRMVTKGCMVYVCGEVEVRDYTSKDGQPKRSVETIANEINIISSNKGKSEKEKYFDQTNAEDDSQRAHHETVEAGQQDAFIDDDVPF